MDRYDKSFAFFQSKRKHLYHYVSVLANRYKIWISFVLIDASFFIADGYPFEPPKMRFVTKVW